MGLSFWNLGVGFGTDFKRVRIILLQKFPQPKYQDPISSGPPNQDSEPALLLVLSRFAGNKWLRPQSCGDARILGRYFAPNPTQLAFEFVIMIIFFHPVHIICTLFALDESI